MEKKKSARALSLDSKDTNYRIKSLFLIGFTSPFYVFHFSKAIKIKHDLHVILLDIAIVEINITIEKSTNLQNKMKSVTILT